MEVRISKEKWDLAFGISASCYFFFAYAQMRGLGLPNVFYAVFKIVLLVWGVKSYFSAHCNKRMKSFMMFFIIYSLLSGVVYLFNGKPFSVLYDALSNYVLPMLMFFIGMSIQNTKRLFIPFIIGLSISLFLTIIPYLNFSSWYIDYILSSRGDTDIVGEDYLLGNLRFSGVTTSSYFIMYLCFPVLTYMFSQIVVNKNRNVWIYFASVICLFSLILCQQRTALLFSVIAILYFFVFLGSNNRKASIIVILILAAISFILPFLFERFDVIIDLISGRVEKMSFSTAFVDERQAQVTRVFSVWQNPIFGDGIGVYSHAAHFLGYVSVNDCAWIKLLVENGVVGLSLFLYLVINSVLRGLRYRQYFYSELLILLFFIVAMIGYYSLSMATPYSIFFWYALGRVWNPHFES